MSDQPQHYITINVKQGVNAADVGRKVVEAMNAYRAKARRSDPVTSHMAAADASRHAPTNRQRALEALRRAGEQGLTDFELAAATGLAQTSVGVRRKELRDAGLVEAVTDAAGVVVKRPAPSGSLAIVWRAVA